MDSPIRVMIVDDSAVVRQTLTALINKQSDMKVVETAIDPIIAQQKLPVAKPHILILDMEMPRMDGITFLGILMEKTPMPVIVFSSVSQPGSVKALEALRLGAVDVLGKPHGSYSVGEMGIQLVEKIRGAAHVKINRRATSAMAQPLVRPSVTKPINLVPPTASVGWDGPIVLIGASTGGTEALKEVLMRLPENFPPLLIVQHIPPVFSKAFADRLNDLCAIDVKEACDGDGLRPGLALVAPGNYHMMLARNGRQWRVRVADGPPVWHQRPAVDVLFKSAVEHAGPRIVAAILTGMGKDGAEGLLKLRKAGAKTFGQTEETCVVYGMPRAAFELGACEKMVPLQRMAEQLCQSVHLASHV